MKCKDCGTNLSNGAPYEEVEDYLLCGDCAFKRGIIDGKAYLKRHIYFIDLPNLRAEVHNGEIYISTYKFSWEKDPKKRDSKAYTQWRNEVFQRDKYTCQSCGKRGGTLNAHHIKPYAKYEEFRTDVNNGITLCVECHRKAHKKEGVDLSQSEECLQKQ